MMKKYYTKQDIDVQGEFQYNNFAVLRSKSKLYEQIPARKKDTGHLYRGYLLINYANPSNPIKQTYLSITLANPITYCKSRIFSELLLNIYGSQPYKKLSKEQLKQQTFGLKRITAQQKRIFQQVLQLKYKVQQNQITLKQLDGKLEKEFSQNWTTIQFKNQQDEQIAKQYVLDYLYSKCKWFPFQHKWRRLQMLHKGLSLRNIKITEKRIIKQSNRRYLHQTLVMIPEKQYQCITLQNLINIMKTTHNHQLHDLSINKVPSSAQFAYKLYKALQQYKLQFNQIYQCLSPHNILYQYATGQLKLDILVVIYFKLAIQQDYLTFAQLFNTAGTYNFYKQFWISADHIKKQNKFDDISSFDLLWQFIFIVDYFEKGNNSYFKNSLTLSDLKNKQHNIYKIYNKGELNKYFGEHTTKILTYLKKQKQMAVSQFLKLCKIEDLQEFYESKMFL